jgi:hypothetical protein
VLCGTNELKNKLRNKDEIDVYTSDQARIFVVELNFNDYEQNSTRKMVPAFLFTINVQLDVNSILKLWVRLQLAGCEVKNIS